MKRIRSLAAAALVMSGLAGQAQAQLLGVVQNYPDTTATASPYLVYDHDAVNSTTGRLRLVSGAAQLAEGPSAGGSSITQSYFGAGDSIPDVLLSIDVRNGTGGFTAGTFVSGLVSIGFGNSSSANRWKWDGTITALGSQSGTGTILDAMWNVTGDQYQNMPADMSQFINGFLTGGVGGIKINSSASWGTAANFSNDWVFGLNPSTNSNLDGYRTGMTSPVQTNSTITADVFASPVPEPAVAWLVLIGLAFLAPLARGRKTEETGVVG